MNYKELAKELKTTESMVRTNFPKLCSRMMSKGIKITKIGVGEKADYTLEKVEPQIIDKKEFSTVTKEVISENLPNEVWVDCYIAPNEIEVSNMGRVRNKKTKVQHKGSILPSGYHQFSISGKNISGHRLVLFSFYPIENANEMTVDHINGIKTDNRLENLRWVSAEDNVYFMIINRGELNKALTKIVQKYGYDKTLEILLDLGRADQEP